MKHKFRCGKEIMIYRRKPELPENWIFILVAPFAFALIAISGASAAPKSCQLNIPAVSVKYKSYAGDVEIHRSYSSSQLTSKLEAHGKLSRKAGWVHLGLTEATFENRIAISFRSLQIGEKQRCIGLQSVSLQVGYPRFDIYIARGVSSGSCEYRTTMAHERAHVAIYRDQLRKFDQRIESRLKGFVAGLRPVLSHLGKSTDSYFLKQINNELKPLFDQLGRENDILNNRLDTPENYQREQALCPGVKRTR